jgi:hypothetical protein
MQDPARQPENPDGGAPFDAFDRISDGCRHCHPDAAARKRRCGNAAGNPDFPLARRRPSSSSTLPPRSSTFHRHSSRFSIKTQRQASLGGGDRCWPAGRRRPSRLSLACTASGQCGTTCRSPRPWNPGNFASLVNIAHLHVRFARQAGERTVSEVRPSPPRGGSRRD